MAIRSLRTVSFIFAILFASMVALPIFFVGTMTLHNLAFQLTTEGLFERIKGRLNEIDQHYERLRILGLDDSPEHLEMVKLSGLRGVASDFSQGWCGLPVTALAITKEGAVLLGNDIQGLKDQDMAVQKLLKEMDGKIKGVVPYEVQGAKKLACLEYYPPWRAYVGAGFRKGDLHALHMPFTKVSLLAMAAALALAFLLALVVHRFFIIPLTALSSYAVRVSMGDYGGSIEGRFPMELGVLKTAFEEMVARVKENMAEIVRQLKLVKAREAERDEALRTSQLNEERLAVTIRCMGDGVVSTDISARIVLMNRAAERLLGVSHAEAIGREVDELFTVEDKEQRGVTHPVREALLQGRLIEGQGRQKFMPKGRDEFDCAYVCSPILDSSSRIIGAVLVFRDMTEHNRLAEQALTAQKLESVGLLAGGIAHDFNNILTPICSGISAALANLNEPERLETLLRPALKAADRAVGLTHQLLTFAKGGEPVREDASLEEIVRDTAGFVLSGSSISCSYDFAPDLWLAKVDRRQISQVVQNIVLNARQAMEGYGSIAITAENFEYTDAGHGDKDCLLPLAPGRYLRLTIEDTGPGVPQHILHRIFEPYFTTKSDGSGLGLAVTHSIVTRHGGHIAVSSAEGKGAVFTVYLPASDASVQGQAVHAEAEKRIVEKGARLIIMDDEEMILELAQVLLEDMGYQVMTARDGKEAIELYKTAMNEGRAVDAVIMDITVPGGMGAMETLPELLKIDCNVKAIVSSGYSQDPVMSSYKEYGFAAALPKPYRMAELAAVLERISV